MAYTINKTDGTIVTTITDGTVDNTTSLQLFGKSYSGFGEGLNENLVKLLENAASTSSPTAPLRGELWFDTNTNQLKVYNGTQFEPAGGSQPSATVPSSPSAGDLWLDSTNDQLFVYTGDSRSHQTNDKWELIGPSHTAGQGESGMVIETIASSGGDKVVASLYTGTTRVAILSKEDFTPTAPQTGFASIKAGFTLNSTLGAVFEGTNTQAANIDVSTTSNPGASLIAGGNFLRSDVSDTTAGALTITNDSGITLGASGELTVSVSSNNVTIAQTSEDKDLSFTINDGGVTKTPIALTGATGAIGLTGDVTITGNLNVSGAYNYTSSDIVQHSDTFLKVNAGGGEADAGLIVETGDTDDARLFYDVSENYWVAGENATYSQIIRLTDAVSDGDANKEKLLKTTAAGNLKVTTINLAAVGSAISTGDTSSTSVPTIGQIATFGNKWGGSEKTVSTVAPTNGAGNDGDFWFVREE